MQLCCCAVQRQALTAALGYSMTWLMIRARLPSDSVTILLPLLLHAPGRQKLKSSCVPIDVQQLPMPAMQCIHQLGHADKYSLVAASYALQWRAELLLLDIAWPAASAVQCIGECQCTASGDCTALETLNKL